MRSWQHHLLSHMVGGSVAPPPRSFIISGTEYDLIWREVGVQVQRFPVLIHLAYLGFYGLDRHDDVHEAVCRGRSHHGSGHRGSICSLKLSVWKKSSRYSGMYCSVSGCMIANAKDGAIIGSDLFMRYTLSMGP